MCGYRLGNRERAARLEIGGDPGGPKRVAADLDLESELLGPPADHAVGIILM
jgi:hypothetical protein